MSDKYLKHPAERCPLRAIWKEKNRQPTIEQLKEQQRLKKLKKKRRKGR